MSNLSKFLLLNIIFALIFITCQYDKANQEKAIINNTTSVRPVKEMVMDGLKRPWSMAFLSPTESLVAEKDGDLLKVNLTTKEKRIIQGFPSDLADSLVVIAKDYPLGTYPTGTKIAK